MTLAEPRVRPAAAEPAAGGRPWPVATRLATAGVVLTLVVAGLARLWSPSQLWLDEALTVNIARLPLAQLPEALRHDGSPPLFYLLLHGWIALVGSGTTAVRLLPALFGLLALPVLWLLARDLAGSVVAWIAVLVLATSPFALYYSTEARMYSLVVLLSAGLLWALRRLVRAPSWRRALPVSVLSAALALTHYWALFLLAVLGVGLLAAALRPDRRRRCLAGALALAAGGVLFAPWLPIFLFQAAHTGAPWSGVPEPNDLGGTFQAWAGRGTGGHPSGLLALVLLVSAALGLLAQPLDGVRRVELDLAGRPLGRRLAAVTMGTLVLALVVSHVQRSGFAPRYTSVALVPFLLLVALGVQALPVRWRAGTLVALVLLGLQAGLPNLVDPARTQAPALASDLQRVARPGDVVAYCPDQLGPAVSRLAPSWLHQVTYPAFGDPHFVDWVDYAQRNAAASPAAFSAQLLRQAAGHTVYLVWLPGYPTFGTACTQLRDGLQQARGTPVVIDDAVSADFEHAYLYQFRP